MENSVSDSAYRDRYRLSKLDKKPMQTLASASKKALKKGKKKAYKMPMKKDMKEGMKGDMK